MPPEKLEKIERVARIARIIFLAYCFVAMICLFVFIFPPILSFFNITDWMWSDELIGHFFAPMEGLLLIILLIGMSIYLLIESFAKSQNQRLAEQIVQTFAQQQQMQQQMQSILQASCPFPWYTANATTDQRIAFETELRRLAGSCEKGKKGGSQPLVDWLLSKQSEGLILLPNNYSQIYQELTLNYGLGISKQAFSSAMPQKGRERTVDAK